MKNFVLSLFALMIGCSGEPVLPGLDGGGGPSVALDAGGRIETVIGTASSCGGFESDTADDSEGTSSQADSENEPANGSGYCDAELLRWSCNATNPGLKLQLTRQSFQCCADLKVTLAPEDDAYRLTIADQANDVCDCMCVFDAEVHSANLPCEPMDLRIKSGTFTLPLNEQAGTLVVSTATSHYCRQ